MHKACKFRGCGGISRGMHVAWVDLRLRLTCLDQTGVDLSGKLSETWRDLGLVLADPDM